MTESKQSGSTGGGDPHVAGVLRQVKAQMLRMREKLSEPLAIVGMGCRFPGANGPAEYWDLLQQGRCAIRPTPNDRWPDSLKANQTKEAGKITANCGGYLDQVDLFDPGFFGISAREAETMDPQQRLLLEVVWETLEHAGINPHQTRGLRVGAFVGISSHDYLHRLTERNLDAIDPYLGTGNAHSVAAGRLSYVMHWQGPSVSVDTACSSSLTAIHMAARSLRYGDCEMAVAAGVNVILAPELSVSLSQAGMLSPTGRCHTFDAAADGFVRGEGCGAILMKRLSQAVEDGDQIYCVIKGTAANQDGRSNGLTAPNGNSQQAVIRQALHDARVRPEEVDYIEAHGTGTQLGDPIEISGLKGVFAASRTSERVLRLGSAKTNLGHLEAAAGIAGAIKLALSIHHGQIPPHLHFENPSKQIDWDWPAKPVTELQPWNPNEDRPRTAGVSSFGFGGSNSHAILVQTPAIKTASTPGGMPKETQATLPQLFVLSAKSDRALVEMAARYADFLAGSKLDISEVCYTAALGRAHFEHRLAVEVQSLAELVAELNRYVRGEALSKSSHVSLEASKAAYLSGKDLDWSELFPSPLPRVALPTYAFQRKRCWFADTTTDKTSSNPGGSKRSAANDAVTHPLLGHQLDIASSDVIFETDLQEFVWIADHRIDGSIIFPAAGLLELAVAAGEAVHGQFPVIQSLQIERPIICRVGMPCRVQVLVQGTHCEIANHDGNRWQTAARCELLSGYPNSPQDSSQDSLQSGNLSFDTPKPNGHSTEVAVDSHYAACLQRRIEYGEAFQGVTKLFSGGDISWGETELPSFLANSGYRFHPAWLDACLQVAAPAIPAEEAAGLVPIGIERFQIITPPRENEKLFVSAKVAKKEGDGLSVCLMISLGSGETVAEVQALTLKPFTTELKSESTAFPPLGDIAAELVALPAEARISAVRDYLHVRVADVMGTAKEEIPLDRPLDGLGLDSLMAFELRDELERNLRVMIPMEVFLQEITLNEFSGLVAEKLVSPIVVASPDPNSDVRSDARSDLNTVGDLESSDDSGENWIEGEI